MPLPKRARLLVVRRRRLHRYSTGRLPRVAGISTDLQRAGGLTHKMSPALGGASRLSNYAGRSKLGHARALLGPDRHQLGVFADRVGLPGVIGWDVRVRLQGRDSIQ
jgi:hypothetical protein